MAKSNPLVERVNIVTATPDTQLIVQGFFEGSLTGVTDIVGVFAPACILQAIDTGISYQNTGTTAAPVFAVIDTSSGGLPALLSARIWVGNAGNVATAVAMSGDVTLNNAGVAAIAAGVIVNADINASAAIDYSKLAALPSAQILVGSAGNVATAVAVTGDVTISNAGVTAIGAGVIVNADVNAAAAIDFSKLASLPSAQILVGSAGNVPTATAVTGDVTISNGGVTAIAADIIVNADINTAAAIDFSKLAALPSAQILVGSAGNVATAVAVTGDVTISNGGVTAIASDVIVDADINTAAAIAFSKLAALTSANILVGSAGNVATAVAMSGDAAISNAGVVTVTDLTITGETAGDIIYFNGTNWIKLAIGTAGQVLTVNGGATAPVWA